MNTLIADSLDDAAIEQMREAGDDVVLAPDLTAVTLPAHVGDTEVLVARSTGVTAATIDAGRNLALIGRAGAGTDNIDSAHAAARAVMVCNVPGEVDRGHRGPAADELAELEGHPDVIAVVLRR